MSVELDGAYAERVYAGVLGKIIGVYAGRPFEGWTHDRIVAELGEIDRFVHGELGDRLIAADDDISGTFTFLRALADNGFDPKLTPEQIGKTWLNYILEERAVLWWGGMGTSTEHTAFLRLKHGIPAPRSGSVELNGRTVAEQIGAQIFIDGWGLINPGDPERAADFARRAGSVSHDGEALHGAQVVAAMVAESFLAPNVRRVVEAGAAVIPTDSLIATMIRDIRAWHKAGSDWRAAFRNLERAYGYAAYGGGCHIVPNHGIVILALLYGAGDFSRSLMLANTCGWDTDCNSGNVGCVVGVLGGLAGMDGGYDWRAPVRDRLFLPTADGGRCVTDAVRETEAVVRTACALRGTPYTAPKAGARFTFAYPGSVQGFVGDGLTVRHDDRSLQVILTSDYGTALTPTFPYASERVGPGYGMLASPTLYPGQRLSARVANGPTPMRAALAVATLQGEDEPRLLTSPDAVLEPGTNTTLEWTVPDTQRYPVTAVGIALAGVAGARASLDWLTWDGSPRATLGPTAEGGAWRDAWVNAVSDFSRSGDPIRLIQNEGTGLLVTGTREWTDICVESEIEVHLIESAGLAVRVQGLRRYYALRVLRNGTAQLVRCLDDTSILAEAPFEWRIDDRIGFRLSASGSRLRGELGSGLVLEAEDDALPEGAAGFLVTEGRIGAEYLRVGPADGP